MVLETDNSKIAATDLPKQATLYKSYAGDDEHLAGCDLAVEKIVHWATDHYGPEEIATAKEEFFWKNGKVFPEDPFFNLRMVYFLDFFIFQRALPAKLAEGLTMTPFEDYMFRLEGDAEFPLTGHLHSIFEVGKLTKGDLILRDLISFQKITVSSRPGQTFKYLNRGMLAQGFLYHSSSHYWISHGIVIHPSESWKLIKSRIKTVKKNNQFDSLKELTRLARQQLRCERHRHVPPKRIYLEESW